MVDKVNKLNHLFREYNFHEHSQFSIHTPEGILDLSFGDEC